MEEGNNGDKGYGRQLKTKNLGMAFCIHTQIFCFLKNRKRPVREKPNRLQQYHPEGLIKLKPVNFCYSAN
jgi:hypothetical protein